METLQVVDQRELCGKQFRIFGDFENPLFLAKDVADWIEHSDTSTMLRRVDTAEKLTQTLFVSGQNREMWFLTEDGLYEVLMQSRKPIAKEFKREVKAILRNVRKHGAHMTTAMIEKVLSDPDIIIGLATELKAERLKREKVERDNQVLKPKADKYDEFLDSSGLTSLTIVGKSFLGGITAQQTRKFLQQEGVLFQKSVDGAYPPRVGYERYFRVVPYYENGRIVQRSTKVTSEGIDFIVDLWRLRHTG
ncbi:BRO family protein [Paenibacillus dendritiformis]|uniref:BRO family protein n=1 Tax=Paenibacillus dendritiformis TaxID=130049 RepID=UPI00387E05D6